MQSPREVSHSFGCVPAPVVCDRAKRRSSVDHPRDYYFSPSENALERRTTWSKPWVSNRASRGQAQYFSSFERGGLINFGIRLCPGFEAGLVRLYGIFQIPSLCSQRIRQSCRGASCNLKCRGEMHIGVHFDAIRRSGAAMVVLHRRNWPVTAVPVRRGMIHCRPCQ